MTIKRKNTVLTLIIGSIIMAATLPCYAADGTAEAVFIKADEMHFDLNSKSSIYKGNVTIRKGSIELNGNHVEIVQSKNIISKILASGNPATFSQSGEDGNIMRAESKQIQYFADEDKLIMLEDAKLIQNEQIIESDHISYDTQKQALIAGKQSDQSDSPQRVKMTLTPTSQQ